MRGTLVLLFVIGVALTRAQVEKCPAEQETDWGIELLLRHEDCNKFYKCTYGKPVEQTCFDYLYFNLETWQCDWPENVDCEDRNDPATKPTPEPTTPVPTTPEPTTAEPTTPELTTPEPTTPEPTTAEPTTPAPTTPEPTTAEPTTPEPTTSEPTTPEPTAAPTATPEVGIEFLPNGCPADPHVHWLLPNKSDCNRFYYCVRGELVPRECPAGLHFNHSIQGASGGIYAYNKVRSFLLWAELDEKELRGTYQANITCSPGMFRVTLSVGTSTTASLS